MGQTNEEAKVEIGRAGEDSEEPSDRAESQPGKLNPSRLLYQLKLNTRNVLLLAVQFATNSTTLIFVQNGTRVWRIRAFAILCVFALLPLAILTIVTLVKVTLSWQFVHQYWQHLDRKKLSRKTKHNWQKPQQKNLTDCKEEAPTAATSEIL